ncbi:hypothetical protein [Kitasatospora sp. NPDC057223]|uniref:hypothetical protein n=1 Tax=Kitasatospora sp. NPDC057223 TaxID=3346055 RepID=UPI0036425784
MALTVSAVVLLGVLAAFLIRARRTTVPAAIACALFGFLLASTGLAPAVNSVLGAVTEALAGIG